jgi:O-antigen ligase
VGNTLFVEHSAFGVGLGASPLAMKLRYEEFPVTYQPPHYVPLTAALETGVVGGVFYLVLFLAPFADFLLHWRSYIQNPRAIGVLALILAITVISLFDYYTWLYAPGRLWQWLAWGLYSVVSEKVG